VVAASLIFSGIRLSSESVVLLITALSIFAALLLNLLLMVHGLVRRYRDDGRFQEARRLLRELYANLAYGVLVCIVGIVPLVAFGFGFGCTVNTIICGAVFFLVCNFLLTLLMILKRVHVLLSNEFKYPNPRGVRRCLACIQATSLKAITSLVLVSPAATSFKTISYLVLRMPGNSG
jgi:hypothetical protein